MGKFNLSLDIDEKEVAVAISEELNKELNKILSSKHLKENLHERAKLLIAAALVNCDEWRSLEEQFGKLRWDLGLEDPSATLQEILNRILASVQVNVEIVLRASSIRQGPRTLASFEVVAVKGDYNDLINVPGAAYYSNDHYIPWLYWLLFSGTQKIVKEYVVRYGFYPKSRSQHAIMVSRKKKKGTGFRIDSRYAGVAENNFITRALDTAGSELERFMRQQLLKGFQ